MMAETCKRCGREQRLGWSVRHDMWKAVEKSTGCNLLCLECFLEALEKADIHLELGDFLFLGIWDAKAYGFVVDGSREAQNGDER